MKRRQKQKILLLKQVYSLKELTKQYIGIQQILKRSPSYSAQNNNVKPLKIACLGKPFRVTFCRTAQSAQKDRKLLQQFSLTKPTLKVKKETKKRNKQLGLQKIINFHKLKEMAAKDQNSTESKSIKNVKKPRKRENSRDNLKDDNNSNQKDKRYEYLNRFNALTAQPKSIHRRDFNKTGYCIKNYQKSLLYNKESLKKRLNQSYCFSSLHDESQVFENDISPWNKQIENDQVLE